MEINVFYDVLGCSILTPGMEYGSLKKSFVIFICNYDEYGRGRYLYTFENICREEPDLKFGDESYKVVVNTKGKKGDINGAIKLYHDELGLVPEEIVSRIAVRFSLREDIAERYVEDTLNLNGSD